MINKQPISQMMYKNPNLAGLGVGALVDSSSDLSSDDDSDVGTSEIAGSSTTSLS
jgi:hypothetical protein